MEIAVVGEGDLPDLLPLMRSYCDFYNASPTDERFLVLARSLLTEPDCEGFQVMARDGTGRAIGFATVYWTWSTLAAARKSVMNDLFVEPAARGSGVAEALIEECRLRSGRRGAAVMSWQTAKSNLRAQRVYERVGAKREEWVDYSIGT